MAPPGGRAATQPSQPVVPERCVPLTLQRPPHHQATLYGHILDHQSPPVRHIRDSPSQPSVEPSVTPDRGGYPPEAGQNYLCSHERFQPMSGPPLPLLANGDPALLWHKGQEFGEPGCGLHLLG
ncbi:hypothetical protein P7K49_017394 [Saguinus oedipus]|uniref:Uncharacterized protein n=1 Tax=Saguinus oedipus TaxID=9490 RepID=A0ABQ9V492_SAGOE|nr:hypothetical protein P7K49_017394 [Saguinus oedipus]